MKEDTLTAIDNALDNEVVEAKTIAGDSAVNKPRPFTSWNVGGNSYRLKLTATWITKLEQQFGKPLMLAVTEDGVPPLTVVLPLLQAALQKFNHGIKSDKVAEMYDQYVEEGHTILDLLGEVIYPLMYDAGFFTKAQQEMMSQQITDIDSEL